MQENKLNLFQKTTYSFSEEDRVTNALLLIFQHSDPSLVAHFLGFFSILYEEGLDVIIKDHLHYDDHNIIDGEISLNREFVVAIEVKIYRGKFELEDQVASYFKLLVKRSEKRKLLLLISPDDNEPPIIDQIPNQNLENSISWVSWSRIYTLLKDYHKLSSKNTIERYLLSEFLDYLEALGLSGEEDRNPYGEKLSSRLKYIFGNETAEKILLHIYHFKGAYGTQIAKGHNIDLYAVQQQLKRFEKSGVLRKERQGRTVLYYFNYRSPFFQPIYELIRRVYDTIPLSEKERIFNPRFQKKRR